jgi:hypothetical protein
MRPLCVVDRPQLGEESRMIFHRSELYLSRPLISDSANTVTVNVEVNPPVQGHINLESMICKETGILLASSMVLGNSMSLHGWLIITLLSFFSLLVRAVPYNITFDDQSAGDTNTRLRFPSSGAQRGQSCAGIALSHV